MFRFPPISKEKARIEPLSRDFREKSQSIKRTAGICIRSQNLERLSL